MQPQFPDDIFKNSNTPADSPASSTLPQTTNFDSTDVNARVSQTAPVRISLATSQTLDKAPILRGPKKYNEWMELGNTHLNNLDYDHAVDAFTQALALNPNSQKAKESLIRAYYSKRDLGNAIKIYEEIYKKQVDFGILIFAAAAYYETRRIDKAIETCHKMLQHKQVRNQELQYGAYKILSDCHFLLGEFELAIETALKSLYINPHSLQMLHHLALCYYNIQDFQLAISVCKDYLKSDPLNFIILELLSKSQRALGLYREASINLNIIIKNQNSEAAKKQFPGDTLKKYIAAIRDMLGNCYLHLGDLEKGYREYLKAFELDQDYPHSWCSLKLERDIDLCRKLATTAEYHVLNNRLEQSIELYTDILNRNPGNMHVLELRAFAFMRIDTSESISKAILDLTAILKQVPDCAKIFSNRAELFYKLEMLEEAICDYSKLSILEPENRTFFLNFGIACYKIEKYHEKALQLFSTIIANPSSEIELIQALIYRGNILQSKDKYQEALADLTRANKLYDSNPQKFPFSKEMLKQLYLNLSVLHKLLNNHAKSSFFTAKILKSLGYKEEQQETKEPEVSKMTREPDPEAPSSALSSAPSAPASKDREEKEASHKLEMEKQKEAAFRFANQESKERELKRQEERKQRELLAKQKEAQEKIQQELKAELDRRSKKFEVHWIDKVKAGPSKKRNASPKSPKQNFSCSVPDWWTDTEKTDQFYHRAIPAKPNNDMAPSVPLIQIAHVGVHVKPLFEKEIAPIADCIAEYKPTPYVYRPLPSLIGQPICLSKEERERLITAERMIIGIEDLNTRTYGEKPYYDLKLEIHQTLVKHGFLYYALRALEALHPTGRLLTKDEELLISIVNAFVVDAEKSTAAEKSNSKLSSFDWPL